MSQEKKRGHEDLESVHEAILAQGDRRFPVESYRQLRESGTERDEAIELLGFDPQDPALTKLT